LLVDNLKKCPLQYDEMITQGREGQIRFVHEVAKAFDETQRSELAKVSEDLISDDDFSRQSTVSSVEFLDSSSALSQKEALSIPTAKPQLTTPLTIIQKKPPPPSGATKLQSSTLKPSKASSSTTNLHSEDEDELEEEEEFEEDEEDEESQGSSRQFSVIDREAEEEKPSKRGKKRRLSGDSVLSTQSSQPSGSQQTQSVPLKKTKKTELEAPVKDAGIGSVFFQMNRITQRRINVYHHLLRLAQDSQVW